MSGIVGKLQELGRRVGALETDDLDEAAQLTQIKKLFADFEIDVKFTYHVHQYRIAGDEQPLYGAVCGTDTFL